MGEQKRPDADAIREQLQRVLVSPVFLHSDRLRRFLTHCVEAELSGRVDALKEYAIGVAAFDRPKHYNPAEDPIVRVEARRLRTKLDQYYQDRGSSDPIVIQIPKGGYLPVFAAGSVKSPLGARTARAGAGVLALCGVAAGFWLFWSRPAALPVLELTRFTSDHGFTTDPALSADGTQLAYASDRSGSSGLDIWIQRASQQATGDGPRQLTADPADDSQPAISPDGSAVAFRSERQPPGVYVAPVAGGEARLLARDGRNPRYSPDGRWMAYWVGSPGGDSLRPFGKTYIIPSAGGAARQVLTGFASAVCPVWSPESRIVLVEASAGPAGALDLWAVPVDGGHAAETGIARLAGRANLRFALRECSLSWGDSSLVLSAWDGDTQNLWRVRASPEGRPTGRMERFTFGSAQEAVPSAAASGAIAFASRSASSDIWRFPVDHPEQLTRITDGAGAATFPSAAGGRLTFLAKTDGGTAVWWKNLQNGQELQLTKPAAEPRYPQLCDGGETVVYSDGPDAFAVSPRAPGARLICNGCSRVWQCGNRGIFYVPAGSKSPVEIHQFLLPTGPRRPLVVSSQYDLANARLSRDGWIAFHAITGVAQRQIFVARYRETAIPPADWIAATDGAQMDRNAVWNESSDTLYFLSERCGFRCIWSQRLDPSTKRPMAGPIPVRHFHSARLGLSAIGDVGAIGLSYAGGYLYLALAEQGGDVWLARPAGAERTVSHP